jgi:ubiquinone/menaquinone biosynthesis C-methylase UbiE
MVPLEKYRKHKSMKNIFKKYYKKYDAWYDENKNAFLSELQSIKKVLPKKGKGLEIGIGTGRFASSLGIEYGIDPSENMVKTARERGLNVQLGFGEKLPFDDSTFDYVAIINTLCFVKAPSRVLREAERVLKRNGKIIIGIIDRDNFLGEFYQKKKSSFYGQAHFFTTEDVTKLLLMAGFHNFSYWQTLFSFPDEISKVEKPRKGFDQGGFIVIRGKK